LRRFHAAMWKIFACGRCKDFEKAPPLQAAGLWCVAGSSYGKGWPSTGRKELFMDGEAGA